MSKFYINFSGHLGASLERLIYNAAFFFLFYFNENWAEHEKASGFRLRNKKKIDFVSNFKYFFSAVIIVSFS